MDRCECAGHAARRRICRGSRSPSEADEAARHRRTGAPRDREGCRMPRGAVATYSVPGHGFAHSHERATRDGIARRLAILKGIDFVGEYDPTQSLSGPVYLVPSDTLVGLAAAAALRVRDEHDLFGGTVPYPFVATKQSLIPLSPRARLRRLSGRRSSGPGYKALSSPASLPSATPTPALRPSVCLSMGQCASNRFGRPEGAGRSWSRTWPRWRRCSTWKTP